MTAPADLLPVQRRAWYAAALETVYAVMGDYRARSGNDEGEEPGAYDTSVMELIGWCVEQTWDDGD